jgi:predicted Zn-dependent peptidase
MNNLIGGGMSSRLYQTLRETHGLVYSVSSSLLSYRRGGALIVEGATSKDKLVHGITLVLMQLMSIAVGENPIDEEELWKSKMQVKSQSRLSTDLVSNRVSRIATQEFHLNRRVPDDEILEQIESVSIADLEEVAYEILLQGMRHLSIAAVGPIETDESIVDELNEIHENFARSNLIG